MTRIISGFAGSLTLAVPKTGTRPTTDRVREAVFSALASRELLDGARVLDLYAGTGALGLEAASRGASEVVLVDHGREAATVLRRNIERVLHAAPAHATPQIRAAHQTVRAYLLGTSPRWDIVFIDPPYDVTGATLAGDLELLLPRLAADAVVVIERPAREPEPAWPDGFTLDRRSDYGETSIFWVRPA